MELFSEILEVLAIPLLIGLNAFFVTAEYALVTLRRTRVEELVKQGRRGSPSVKKAQEQLADAIAASQVGVTLASLGLGWVGEPFLAKLIEPLARFLPAGAQGIATHSAALAIAFVAIMFFHVLLGEQVPKALALQKAESMALACAPPLLLIARIFRPVVRIISFSTNMTLRIVRLPPMKKHRVTHSAEELLLIVEESHREGKLETGQFEYAKNVLRLRGKKVRDVMVPREKMGALEISMKDAAVLEAVRGGAHTRMPVYEGDLDHIVGVVNTKDLFHLYSLNGLVMVPDVMFPALFVSPDLAISEVLREFRQKKRQLAIVRDATGCTLGLVTLEDVVEEIVGDIQDEHDTTPGVRVPKGFGRKPGVTKQVK